MLCLDIETIAEHPSTMSTVLRALAHRLIGYAAAGLRRRQSWHGLMNEHLLYTENDLEALVWAIGCVWVTRIERSICKSPPLNCILLLLGLYVSFQYLVAHLVWYGVPRAQVGAQDDSFRQLLKFAIFILVLLVAAGATPGRRTRRLFAAVTFPFVALLGIATVAFANQVLMPVALDDSGAMINLLIRGPIVGLVIAGVLSLPAVLIYRTAGAAIAVLALIPAVARNVSAAAQSRPGLAGHELLLCHVWPLLCSAIAVASFTIVLRRWLTRPIVISTVR